MTIAKRLYLLVAVAFLGLACVTGLALVQTGRVFTAANFANENTTPSLVLLDKVARAFARVRIYTWQYISVEDPALSPKVLANLEASREEVLTLLGDYEKRDLVDAKDTALLKEDRDAVEAYYVVNRQVADLIGQGKREEGRIYAGQHLDESARVAKALDAHNDYNAQLSARAAEEARAIMDRARWQEGAISLLMTAIVAAIGIVLARRVARSLNEAATIARTVAEGDLRGTIDAGGKDEIGQLMRALRDMRDGLVKIVGQVRQGTDTILSASEEIAQGNMDLSARTESQASSLEETAASMEELTSTVQQNSDNAQQANQLALSATEVAERGGAVVTQVVETMSAINDSSKKIVDIIAVIDGIAFQTNILALNAAVEAARAGEQGRGFAVVATEVRNLAQRSAAAAKEIKALITASVDKVESGTRLVDQAGATMQEVVESIHRVTDIMAEINAASSEQSAGIGQVNQAVIAMDTVTQQNAALVEEAAAAARAMQDQAGTLTTLVGVFKLDAAHAASLVALPAKTARPAANAARITAPRARAVQTRGNAVARPVGAEHEGAEAWEEF